MSSATPFKVKTKTDQTREHLEDMIVEMSAGDQLMPEAKLAEHFGVSLITVRRSLEQLVEKGLVYKVHGKGTIVADRVEVGEEADPSTFNFVYPATEMNAYDDPFLRLVINGISDSISHSLHSLRLMPVNFRGLGKRLGDVGASGILRSGVILANYHLNEDEYALIKRINCPVISIGSQPVAPDIPSVDVDHFNGGREAAKHLIEKHERRKLLFIGGKPQGQEYTVKIYEGCFKAMENAGLDPASCKGFFLPDDAVDVDLAIERIVNGILKSGVEFDSMVSFGCTSTVRVLDKLRSHGLSIPGDVSLIAYNDFPAIANHVAPRITAVHQPAYELGYYATEMLVKMKDEGTEQYRGTTKILGTTLKIRESCGCNGDSN